MPPTQDPKTDTDPRKRPLRLLVLFFTQAEGGAKGYLSRRGEEAAGNLADTLSQFLINTLRLDLEAGFGERATSLAEDLRWRALRSQDALPQALALSHALFPDVLIVSGADTRTMKTAEPVATQLGLPVCVDERLDRSLIAETARSVDGTLGAGLEALVTEIEAADLGARALLVATARPALEEWLSAHLPPDQRKDIGQLFDDIETDAPRPGVFICGAERTPADAGKTRWLFDY